jgi:hypothetical protein
MKWTLNKKQKRYLAKEMLGSVEMVKLFETNDFEWFAKQKIVIGEKDQYGWRPLIVNGEEITLLNFAYNPGWEYDLDHLDEMDECQWCEGWFDKDEMVYRRRGFTKLCKQCQSYLISRGEF